MLARGNDGDGAGDGFRGQRRGFASRWFTGQAQNAQPMDEEAARRHRQRMFQLGLLVCLVLLFVDQKNGRDYSSSDEPGATPSGKGSDKQSAQYGGIPEDKAKRLNTFLGLEPSDGFLYPRNTTGYYRGEWRRLEDLPPLRNDTAPAGHVTLHHRDGRFDMQLYMNGIPAIPELSLVYGYFKLLDGQHSTERDIYAVIKGVYIHKTGRLLMRSMTQQDADSIAFTFNLPASAENGTSDASVNGNHTTEAVTKRMHVRFLQSGHVSLLDEDDNVGRTLVGGVELPGRQLAETAQADWSVGITSITEPAAGEAVASPSSSVLIPNRSKNQYIRQTTSNARKCVFQLDATTTPKFNRTELQPGDSPSADIEEKTRWVEGLEGKLLSPNCRLVLNVTTEAIRLDWGRAYKKAVNYSIVVTLVCVLQIALLFRQLYFSRTQAAASRVSLLTIGQQAILDALLCISHLLLCAMLQPLFAAFASIAFFKLVIFSIFEIRYMFIIHQSRNSQSGNATSFNGLRRQLATLHARFYAILFFILFLLYFLSSYLEVIIFFLYSFWVPQIVMNAHKGVRQPLNHTYVIGMSMARLVIPLYIYGCPQNFVHLLFSEYRPHYKVCVMLVLWMSLQVAVLLSQDIFGPQYMIPARFLPPKYNYYRPVPQTLLRSQSSGDESAIEMTDVESANLPECVICYNSIEINSSGSGYMVSPCDHLFHKECLERWMDIKLECPVCRQPLPPADPEPSPVRLRLGWTRVSTNSS